VSVCDFEASSSVTDNTGSSSGSGLRLDIGRAPAANNMQQSISLSGNGMPSHPAMCSPQSGLAASYYNGNSIHRDPPTIDALQKILFPAAPLFNAVSPPNTISPLSWDQKESSATTSPQPGGIYKQDVATVAVQDAARNRRKGTSKEFSCTVTGCSQTFTTKHNLRCKIFILIHC
jgi:hypothetical protein